MVLEPSQTLKKLRMTGLVKRGLKSGALPDIG